VSVSATSRKSPGIVAGASCCGPRRAIATLDRVLAIFARRELRILKMMLRSHGVIDADCRHRPRRISLHGEVIASCVTSIGVSRTQRQMSERRLIQNGGYAIMRSKPKSRPQINNPARHSSSHVGPMQSLGNRC
jgi:hypothetical protein